MVLPFLVLFPQYFGGKIEYGDMAQANFAFAQVYAALSLIVAQIEPITNFAAGVQRLASFADAIAPDRVPSVGITSEPADRFGLSQVTLMTPDRKRILIQDLTIEPENRANLLVVGQSGVGKSSLLRAIAGLWTQGRGVIRRPPLAEIFFLPQRPYMLLGSLRDQLIYLRLENEISGKELKQVLKTVRLEDLPERVGSQNGTPGRPARARRRIRGRTGLGRCAFFRGTTAAGVRPPANQPAWVRRLGRGHQCPGCL